jgi:hypothetical protein
MTYTQFEDELLVELVRVADANLAANPNSHGQVDALVVGKQLLSTINEQWINDAVRGFEQAGYVRNVSRPLSGATLFLMVTGEGRRHAEALG